MLQRIGSSWAVLVLLLFGCSGEVEHEEVARVERPDESSAAAGSKTLEPTGVAHTVDDEPSAREAVEVSDDDTVVIAVNTRVLRGGRSVRAPLAFEVGNARWSGADFRAFEDMEADLVTDESGFAKVTLRGTGESKGKRPWVRVIEPGFQQVLARTQKSKGDIGYYVVIATAPGGTARGTLYDVDGEPVSKGSVGIRSATGNHIRQALYRDTASSGSTGRFELHFDGNGPFTIEAQHVRHGSTVVEGFEFDAASPPQDLRIDLCGSGRFAGSVRDSHGRPVAGYELRFTKQDDEPDAHRRRVHADGLNESTIRTDQNGRFDARGLREGRYDVVGKRAHTGDARALVEEPLHTSRVDLSFEVPQYLVAVRVLDEKGRPLEYRSAVRLALGRDDTTEAYAATCDASGHITGKDVPRWTDSDDATLRYLHVLPDVEYVVSAWDPDRGAREERFTIRGEEALIEVDLELPPKRPTASLRVEALTPAGTTFDGEFSVWVKTPAHRPLVSADDVTNDGPPHFELPPGRYEVLVRPDDVASMSFVGLFDEFESEDETPKPRDFGVEYVSVAVELAPGEDRTLRPSFRAKGGLEVLVELDRKSDEPAPRANVTARRGTRVETLYFPNPISGRPNDPQHQHMVATSHGILDLTGGIIPGVEQLATEGLTVGEWTIRATLEGYRADERVVTITGNEVTSTTLVPTKAAEPTAESESAETSDD